MDGILTDAVADLQGDVAVLQQTVSMLLRLLATSGSLSRTDIDLLLEQREKRIETANFRDESRRQHERDMHEHLTSALRDLHQRGAQLRQIE